MGATMTGFVKPYPLLSCPTMDMKNFVLAGPMFYVTLKKDVLCAPQGGGTDGPSIPQFATGLIPPFGFGIAPGSIFHDAAFRRYLLIWNPNSDRFVPANY